MPDVHLNDHQTLPTIIGPFRFVFEFSVFVVRFCGSWPPTLPCKRTDQRHCPSRGTLPIKLEETCLKRGGANATQTPEKKDMGAHLFLSFFFLPAPSAEKVNLGTRKPNFLVPGRYFATVTHSDHFLWGPKVPTLAVSRLPPGP